MTASGNIVAFVGEAPGKSAAGWDGKSGERLASLFSTSVEVMRETTSWYNLIDRYPGPEGYKHHERGGKGSWFPRAEGRESALVLERYLVSSGYRVVVLLGKRVAEAFGVEGRRFFEEWNPPEVGAVGQQWVIIPHPSGVNRWWREMENVTRFLAFLHEHRDRVNAEAAALEAEDRRVSDKYKLQLAGVQRARTILSIRTGKRWGQDPKR